MLDPDMISYLRIGVPLALGVGLLAVAVAMLGALIRGITGAIALARSYRLATSTGLIAQGHVISSVERRSPLPGGFERRMVETIAFTTQSGQDVQGEASRSDVGMEDRTGQRVGVRYDEQNPTRFIAPTDDDEPKWASRATEIGKELVVGGVGLLIVVWGGRLLLNFL